MNIKTASDLMESYSDLPESEKKKFKKRFRELISFENKLKELQKMTLKQRREENEIPNEQ